MKRSRRRTAIWIVSIMAVTLAGIVAPILAIGDSERVSFTATLYSDIIRFEAVGVASLRVTIYDLSENELWSSGLIPGEYADWDRTNELGEQLANGYYLYLAQGWDDNDRLVLNRAGKVVLLPGNQVELKAAPAISGPVTGDLLPSEEEGPIYGPKAYDTTYWYVSNQLGVGTDAPTKDLDIYDTQAQLLVESSGTSNTDVILRNTVGNWKFRLNGAGDFVFRDEGNSVSPMMLQSGASDNSLFINSSGNVGIGTNSPSKDLHVSGDGAITGQAAVGTTIIASGDVLTVQGGSGNLIACYPGGSRAAGAAVFRVEEDGDVYADGTVYSASTAVGSADVAERINVSEWVEAGDVVEIHPEHVGFFRKASGQYSRRVAGIISTSPGVILGNDVDDATGQWDDNRPVLAIAGRVPVKVSTENGPIAVGDLLVSSSIPGVAMKGDPSISTGAVVGKAMEPLDAGEGVIMAQVTLR